MARNRVEAKRIAVVGAGVSGLVAAAELDRAGHEIELFEANAYPGGHTNTVEAEAPDGRWAVDTGFIVFNELNYPNFERLLGELGVASQPADMSFSVSDGRGGFEWATTGPRGLFARPAHVLDLRFHRMLRDLVRFNRDARRLVGSRDRGPSLRRFLADGGYSEYFVQRLLVPQASAVWSADPAQMWSFPAGFLAEFFDNHRVLQLGRRPSWRSITGGSRTYVEALIAPLRDRIRLGTRVRRIHRTPREVVLVTGGVSELFDEVVIATHSDQALRLLADPSPAESELLGAIPYQRNEAVLHTDPALMPRRRAAWASWNYHLTDRPADRTTVTYHMNRLQSLEAERDFFVSLNMTERIDPGAMIRTIDYAHPVFTPEGVAAQRRWAEISGARRTHYCGAYWRWGFHEDGVWSALRVAERLGGRGPLPQPGAAGAAAAIPPAAPAELAEAA
jgi:predicted NAD/FAD-binding protein